MSYTIGFAGKGGTGKSTIAGLVISYLAKNAGRPVLAVDADPNASLGYILGLEAEDTIVGIIDDISANIDKLPAGFTKERLIESRVQQALGEGSGVDLLVMGRPEGPGCYCYANTQLREIIGKLRRSYKYCVIDNEAGLEHLSRRTDRAIDYFFIISDPTVFGIRSAKKILEVACGLKIARGTNHLIVNRVKAGLSGLLQDEIKKLDCARVDCINESSDLLNLSAEGRPVSDLREDSEAARMIHKICEEARWP